jgi:hypothetical protein
MIEKSPETKLYEQSDAMLQEFRDSVRNAQLAAKSAGVAKVFVINGQRYLALPNGDIERQVDKNGE